MVDADKLERAILQIVENSRPDYWAEFTLGQLQARLGEFDKVLAPVSIREIVDAIFALAKLDHVAVEKTSGGIDTPLDIAKRDDENYRGKFFELRSFRIKLTHEGRKAMGHIEVNPTDNNREPDELDDKLPLYRKRVFENDLRLYAQQSDETNRPLTLAMLDLDHFKAVNDTHGHLIGDEVLVGVSKIIADRVEGKGKAYRFGGEEISVLLPNYTVEEGIALAENVRRHIEQSVFGTQKLKMTASLGLAVLKVHTSDAAELLKLADQALYDAKRLGRNLVRVAGEAEPVLPEREPERKQPVPGALSDEQRDNIRATYFRGSAAECPKDGASLRVREVHDMGHRTPTLMVTCPMCGLQEFIKGPN